MAWRKKTPRFERLTLPWFEVIWVSTWKICYCIVTWQKFIERPWLAVAWARKRPRQTTTNQRDQVDFCTVTSSLLYFLLSEGRIEDAVDKCGFSGQKRTVIIWVSQYFAIAFVLHCYTKRLVKITRHTLCHPFRSKTKTNHDALVSVFPRFASAIWNSSFDWFAGLFVSFVIG